MWSVSVECVRVNVCVCVYAPEINDKCFPYSQLCILRQGLNSTELEFNDGAALTGQQTQGSSCLCSPVLGLLVHTTVFGFARGCWGI